MRVCLRHTWTVMNKINDTKCTIEPGAKGEQGRRVEQDHLDLWE